MPLNPQLQLSWVELAGLPHTTNRAQTEWRMVCPYHAGTNPTSFSLDLISGKYHCFSCGVHGRVATPFFEAISTVAPHNTARSTRKRAATTRRTLIEADTERLKLRLRAARLRLSQPTTRQGAATVGDYLAWRNVKLETVVRYGGGYEPSVRFQSPSAANRRACYGSLVFPLHDPVSGQLCNLYARGIDPANYSKRLHHITPGRKGIFNSAAIAAARQKGEPLYLTEGIFDALALTEAGYRYVTALVGFTPFQPVWFKELTQLIIAFDNDTAGKQNAAQLLTKLHENGTSCRRLELPEFSRYKDVAHWWQNQRSG
jgi:DNA primase